MPAGVRIRPLMMQFVLHQNRRHRRSDWTRRDNEADMFVKMVKRLAKGFNFKLCDRIRFEDPETGKKYL